MIKRAFLLEPHIFHLEMKIRALVFARGNFPVSGRKKPNILVGLDVSEHSTLVTIALSGHAFV